MDIRDASVWVHYKREVKLPSTPLGSGCLRIWRPGLGQLAKNFQVAYILLSRHYCRDNVALVRTLIGTNDKQIRRAIYAHELPAVRLGKSYSIAVADLTRWFERKKKFL